MLMKRGGNMLIMIKTYHFEWSLLWLGNCICPAFCW